MRQSYPLMLVMLSYMITLCFCQCSSANCQTCTSNVCTQCIANYAFNSSTLICVQCNAADQVILSNICFTGALNCRQQYQISSASDGTFICTLCNDKYAFNYGTTNCFLCSFFYDVIVNNTCYALLYGCQQYQIDSTNASKLVCTQCIANYAFIFNTTTCE
jgi:hypothetical protein